MIAQGSEANFRLQQCVMMGLLVVPMLELGLELDKSISSVINLT